MNSQRKRKNAVDQFMTNTPYEPKCDKTLSKRIMDMAGEIHVLNTATISVASADLKNILDKTLYRESEEDLVTLNLQNTSPRVNKGITLEFNLDKILNDQPDAFYTQTDFSSYKENELIVQLFGKHVFKLSCHLWNQSYQMRLMDSTKHQHLFTASKSSLTSNNLKDIRKVLTLNFFRLLDEPDNKTQCLQYIKRFYEDLNCFTNEGLKDILTNMQQNFTKTAQLHFYQAFQINFDTVQNVRHEKRNYTVSVPELIRELNEGCIASLIAAHAIIPELVKSHRFIEYLRSRVTNPKSCSYLENIDTLKTVSNYNELVLKNLFLCISGILDEVLSMQHGQMEAYIRLMNPEQWRTDLEVRSLALPMEMQTPLCEEASRLAREKVIEKVECFIIKNINQNHFLDDWYNGQKNQYIELCIESENGKKEILKQLFKECEENISKKHKPDHNLSKSGFNNTLEKMEHARETERDSVYRDQTATLCRTLTDEKEKLRTTGNLDRFVQGVKGAINDAKPTLQTSPVWKQFLLDILNALTFLCTAGISWVVTGRLRIFTAQPETVYKPEESMHSPGYK